MTKTEIEKPDRRYSASNFTSDQIESCADVLSESYLQILRVSLSCDYIAIQTALGLKSVGTVKSRLNRARGALTKALEEKKAAP